jgi:tetratricopeptide (TPR) repeat protein
MVRRWKRIAEVSENALQLAKERFEAGDYPGSRQAALEALGGKPDNVEALRLAGRAGVELGLQDAVGELRRLTELAPDDAGAWRDLGDALASEGRTDEAHAAFEKALELDPEDASVLAQVGHTAAVLGRSEDAISHLSSAARREPQGSSAAISLVEMYKALGRDEEALEAARQVAEADPGDVLASLEVAELSLKLGQLDEAQAAFDRLRQAEDVPEHEVYALHGLAQVAMRSGDADRALALARDALAIDERGLSADLLLHLEVESGGGGDALEGRPSAVISRIPPTRDEIEAALLAEFGEHRRAHLEDRRLQAEDLHG